MVTRHSPLATRLRRAKPRGHFPTPHNRLHRRTLRCLPRAPNSFSKWWPVFRPVGLRLHSLPLPRLQLPPPRRRQTRLESTLTQTPTTVDSKPLTATLSPLSATLTKNQEGG